MPIHDWTRVEAGDFHDFHQCWVVALGNALNGGLLPPGYMAMAEQVTGRPIPDVVTLQAREPKGGPEGGIAVATALMAAVAWALWKGLESLFGTSFVGELFALGIAGIASDHPRNPNAAGCVGLGSVIGTRMLIV